MAPNVLAQDEQRPVRGEERGGVEPAGVAEGGLLAAGAIGRGEHDLGLDRYAQRARGLGRRLAADELERALPAHPAGRGEVEAPLARGVAAQTAARAYLDHVRGQVLTQPHGRDVLGPGDQAFAGQEPGGELLVLAGGSHGDGQGIAVDADLERLLDRQLVAQALTLAPVDALDPGAADVGVERRGRGAA
jgi:hypothetical protein